VPHLAVVDITPSSWGALAVVVASSTPSRVACRADGGYAVATAYRCLEHPRRLAVAGTE
jgi:hypothetical protein